MSKRQKESQQNSDEAMEAYAKLLVAQYAVYRVLDARKRAYEAFLYLFGGDHQDKA